MRQNIIVSADVSTIHWDQCDFIYQPNAVKHFNVIFVTSVRHEKQRCEITQIRENAEVNRLQTISIQSKYRISNEISEIERKSLDESRQHFLVHDKRENKCDLQYEKYMPMFFL